MHGYAVQVDNSARFQRPLIVESIKPHVHIIYGLWLLFLTDIISRNIIFIEKLLRDIGPLAFPLEEILTIRGRKNESFYSISLVVVAIHYFRESLMIQDGFICWKTLDMLISIFTTDTYRIID